MTFYNDNLVSFSYWSLEIVTLNRMQYPYDKENEQTQHLSFCKKKEHNLFDVFIVDWVPFSKEIAFDIICRPIVVYIHALQLNWLKLH